MGFDDISTSSLVKWAHIPNNAIIEQSGGRLLLYSIHYSQFTEQSYVGHRKALSRGWNISGLATNLFNEEIFETKSKGAALSFSHSLMQPARIFFERAAPRRF